MVTYYNRKDLVAFGNYILSHERERVQIIKDKGEELSYPGPDISHADIENWKEAMIHNKYHAIDQ